MFKLINNLQGVVIAVERLSDNAFIPFDPANSDYQQFKQAINDASGSPQDTAQLEDADGNLMSAEEAKAFVATLP
jgi:hypothetical protein